MTRRYISRHIDIDQWSLKRILQHVEELKLDLDQVTISKKTEYEYDSEYEVPCLIYSDLETDNEYHDRLDKEATFKQSAINRELVDYERLSKKYGQVSSTDFTNKT